MISLYPVETLVRLLTYPSTYLYVGHYVAPGIDLLHEVLRIRSLTLAYIGSAVGVLGANPHGYWVCA